MLTQKTKIYNKETYLWKKPFRRYWPVSPTLIAFIIGFCLAVYFKVLLSFCKFTTVKMSFVGLSNYKMIFIWIPSCMFWFTAAFTVVSTVLVNAGFGIAPYC